MLVLIDKIVSPDVKDAEGNVVMNPKDDKVIKNAKHKIFQECISLNEIKSCRAWKKDASLADIEGEVTILYMKGGDKTKKPPTILINESFKSFAERTAILRDKNGKVKEPA